MAYDYNNYKKFYEAMNESQRAKWTESNKNDADFKDFYSRYTSSTPTTNTTKNQTSNSTNWSKTNYKDSDGYYSGTERNAATGGAEFGSTTTPKTDNSNATKVSGTTPTTPTPTTTANSDKIGIIRDGWNQLTYEQQQEKLKATPGLKENLTRYGITSKTNPATDSLRYGEGQYKYNPNSGYYEKVGQGNQGGNQGGNQMPTNKGGWDYQDNSPERTAEIIRNLDDLSKSNPGLFSDYDTFYNAFIAGKGRSPEQEKVLNDYFNKMKQYNKYDNLSSDELGYLLAHGEPAEDYLSYLKYNDPQRYAEIQESRKKNENQIMNETYLNTVAGQAGFDIGDSDFWKWNQEEMGYRDENKDGLDDRLYHAPTEEELKLVDENNQYEQERANLTDAYKWLQEDLTNQYPDADLSTIMLLTSDRGNKIQRALDTLAVSQTKVQGSLKYLQNERATQDKAGQATINEIQKQYGMYYDYSPQGIAELAQAQYAATNITLDQADNGTDTQKQMALQSVLDDYYAKYGDIIQRSEAQVINDVMKLAKDKGITLSQALQENFITPLKSKPDFQTLSSGRTIANSQQDKWAKLSDNSLYNTVTGEIIDASGNTISEGTNVSVGGTAKTGYGKEYTVVSSEQLVNGLSDFLEGYEIGDKGGQCGAFVNKGLQEMGVGKVYDNSKESKLNSKNEEANATAQTGWVAIWDPDKLTGDGNKYGHVGWVIKDNGDGTVTVLDSNGTKNPKTGKYDETVGMHTVNKSSLYGYFNPSKGESREIGKIDYAKVLGWIPTQLRNTDIEKQWYIDIAKEQFEKGLTPFEAAMSIIGFDITNKDPEAQEMKNMVLDIIMKQGEDTMFNSPVLSSIAASINNSDYDGALLTLENQLGNYMSNRLKTDFNRDNMTAAMQAISDFDSRNTNWAAGTWNNLSKYIGGQGEKTIKFDSNLSNLSSALRSLGFTDDEIERMLPKLSYNKQEFKASIDELQKNILNRYNSKRSQHGMPAESRASLLGSLPLSSVYGLNAEMEAINSI